MFYIEKIEENIERKTDCFCEFYFVFSKFFLRNEIAQNF